MVKNYFKLILALVFATNVMAQTAWTTYNTANSEMPSDHVSCIATDSLGNKWIGTFGGGLSYFDGKNWTTFNKLNSGLTSDYINCISIDSEGNKWIGTESDGIIKFDGKNWTTYKYNIPMIFFQFPRITCITIDSNGHKWIGTFGNGIWEFDGTNWTFYDNKNTNITNFLISFINIDSKGNKWIGSQGGGLYKFDGKKWDVFDSKNNGFENDNFNTFLIDSEENTFVGCGNWIYIKKNGEYNWKPFKNFQYTSVMSIKEDTKGNKWVTTYDGLYKFDGTNWITYNKDNSGLSGLPWNNNFELDNLDNKWIVTWEGLSKLSGDGNSSLCSKNNNILIKYNKLCKNSSVTLYSELQNNNYTYFWEDSMNNIIGNQYKITISEKGNYFLKIQDLYCFARNNLNITPIDTTYNSPSICMITKQNNYNLFNMG